MKLLAFIFSLFLYSLSFSQLTCNNWLSTPGLPSYFEAGEIDVPGNQITVEAVFNRTTPYFGGLLYAGDLVSKHNTPSDANYLLRPNDAEITTSNGYFRTPDICEIELNKTYHVAMVYDGSTLKFYRNGFLMSQVPATGNLFQNAWKTRIGFYEPGAVNTNFIGYINEVRIWNVARTQAQIQANMNTSLPNPTTQAGLLGYYTFDNLQNKQGNTTYNGTLGGSASINASNPDCNLMVDSCPVITGICSNWLSTPTVSSAVKIGDLDIPGNQVSVEAVINRTTPYLPGGGDDTEGDVVSKHNDFTDVNYLLRPNHAYITTTNGFFATPDICDIELNKNYHIAMVYDGNYLKFYRDGFLMSQVAATGNLILNNWNTKIGHYDPQFWKTQFVGYTNEVRIWNTARTQAQIKAFMNTSLPNPATQPGLLAYYTFDNLQNKQGNTSYNAVLDGNASINAINPNCSFSIDSCPVTPIPVGGSVIINDYTPVVSFDVCTNNLRVEDASAFKTGDTVLIIQMKGAVIDSSNTASFGTINNYRNAGNYEFNYVKSKSGNIIELKNVLTRQYDLPDGKVQLIRVPYFQDYTVTDTLTCLAWDGEKGGVLVLNVANSVTMNADIDVSGRGFKGGQVINTNSNEVDCMYNDFFYDRTSVHAAPKGESISVISDRIAFGKGNFGSGGGGGNGHNSGGGGGSNGAKGGYGGYQYVSCNAPAAFDNRGLGGNALTYNNASNKIFLGGGGGAGHCNNQIFNSTANLNFSGGDGGGIVIINCSSISGNNFKINSSGSDAFSTSISGTETHDARGGGGAGGTVLINSTAGVNLLSVKTDGGKGGDLNSPSTYLEVGPGGGGSGGIVWFNQATTPSGITISNNGGANGIILYNGESWGTTKGSNGLNVFGLKLPFDITPFKPAIDSVRIKATLTSCNTYSLNGIAYPANVGITKWEWVFDNSTTAQGQSTNQSFSSAGSHTLKLVVTGSDGCKDSATATLITINSISPIYTITQPTCGNSNGSINISSPVGSNFQYSLNGVSYQNAASFSNVAPGSYSLTVKDITSGCVSAPVNVNINSSTLPAAATSSITQPTCAKTSGSVTITSPLGSNLQYSIDGINYQSNVSFSNLSQGTYNITVRNTTNGCISIQATVLINPPPTAPLNPTSTINQPVCTSDNGSIAITSPLGANLQYSIDGINYQASTVFTVIIPGSYNLSVKNTITNCVSTSSVVTIIKGNGTPPAAVTNVTAQPNCVTPTGSVTINSPVGNSYQYSIDGSSYQSSINYSNLVPGNHTIIVKNTSNNCISASSNFNINALAAGPAAPSLNLVQPNCEIQTGTATIQSPVGSNLQYSINGGTYQAAVSFGNLNPGSYSITSKDISTQCISAATVVTINTIPNPPAAPIAGNVTQPSCSNIKGAITIASPASSNFEYSINGSTYTSANVFDNLNPGVYNFIVRDINTRCVSSAAQVTIGAIPSLPPTPVAVVTVQPTCIISTGVISISSPLGPNYEYSVDGIQYQSSTTFSNLPPGNYQLTVRDPAADCISLPANISMKANTSLAGTYQIPSAFTPNRDGINECFGIKYWGVINEFKLIIYNRFGEVVFSTTNPNDCWDGIYKGTKASVGNYVYYIKANTLCGPVEKKGNVLLIR